jgi:hypothetical protein
MISPVMKREADAVLKFLKRCLLERPKSEDSLAPHPFAAAMHAHAVATLGGRVLTPEHCDALIKSIADQSGQLSPAQVAEMLVDRANALGGPKITAQNRDALIGVIVACQGKVTPEHVNAMISGLVEALGGSQINEENRSALAVHFPKESKQSEGRNALEAPSGAPSSLLSSSSNMPSLDKAHTKV